jgi:hypothetical protein
MISCNVEIFITKQFAKKRLTMNASAISNFFKVIDPHKKVNFVKDLGLLIIKTICPFSLLKVLN